MTTMKLVKDARRLEPDLIQATSSFSSDSSASPSANNATGKDGDARPSLITNREALAYLLRYETMVRQQEAENLATMHHLAPLLQELNQEAQGELDWAQDVPFTQLRQAVKDWEESSSNKCMTSDRQLMMVLKSLTENKSGTGDEAISWAEFLQCYKCVVSGMQTIQHLQGEEQRQRAKDRTLTMISLFEPPASRLLGEVRLPETIEIDLGPKEVGETKERPRQSGRVLKAAIVGAMVGALVATTGIYFTRFDTRGNITGDSTDELRGLPKKHLPHSQLSRSKEATASNAMPEKTGLSEAKTESTYSLFPDGAQTLLEASMMKYPKTPVATAIFRPSQVAVKANAATLNTGTTHRMATQQPHHHNHQEEEQTSVRAFTILLGGAAGAMTVSPLFQVLQSVLPLIPAYGVAAIAAVTLVQGISSGLRRFERLLRRRG